MQSNLKALIPDVADLLKMPPSELGGYLIPILRHEDRFLPSVLANCVAVTHGDTPAVKEAAMKALGWLINAGLVVPDYITAPGGGCWYRLTTETKNLKTPSDIQELVRVRQILPKSFLHEAVIVHAVPLFEAGKYDKAVFEAFKQLEIIIRDATGLADLVGVDLVRTAFRQANSNNKQSAPGPLTDITAPDAEQQGIHQLFAGVMLVFRNPPGHKNVDLNAQESAELLIFASHLIRIAEKRIALIQTQP